MSVAHYRGVEKLFSHPKVLELIEGVSKKNIHSISGLKDSAVHFILSLLLENHKRPTFFVLLDEEELESTLSELKTWTRTRDIYTYPYVQPEINNIEHSSLIQQMKSIRAMLENDSQQGVWGTTLEALKAPCFSLNFIDEPVLVFEKGSTWEPGQLQEILETRGFHREEKVEQKGDYAIRGGILDIFTRFARVPVRIEFYGDEIETIREFNVMTQRSIRTLSRFVLDDLDFKRASALERDSSIADYLPSDSLFFIQEPLLQGFSELSPASYFKTIFPSEDFDKIASEQHIVSYGQNLNKSDFQLRFAPLDSQALELKEAQTYLQKECANKDFFLIEDYNSGIQLGLEKETNLWRLEGSLKDNFYLPDLNVQVVHEKNIVQVTESKPISREALLSDFIELKMGDYIVHEGYGIGQFLGLRSMERSGATHDYLLLQFSDQTKIYVSVAQLNLVQKYIGRDDGLPVLSKIGSKAWDMKKKKARKAIDRIVMELVHRQAFREKQEGFSFSTDSKEQRAFEKAFPYNETACQLQATSRIKKDMEGLKPMDHLLCGDVGFGKTEVAMRAAHKAILDNKQVAILAPTTVLAEQHYHNFVERFKDKEGSVGVINRFKTASQNSHTLSQIANGDMMVLIGTHRLLSKDVQFKDLGLLVMDEEQRFGVKQKEALKKKFPNIDVLSLSATPIPRTLHLSMLGIRNISSLTIAPENRQPIRTYIREFDKGIIKHAIKRELDRGGQTYFLHNRIEDILEVKASLQELFPEARIGLGHGQMKEKELSSVMNRFYALNIDIFLSTTIIANGIDIPTANTMIINNAHMFGLSELHQIRGRIGRYSIQAYAYLLLPTGHQLSKNSLRRLRAVEEHQELGAGFKLAMKDMEIRGVGNILGQEQHGQISDVGYELYTQYLSQAISEASGESGKPGMDTELSWQVGSTYLPQTYIPSNNDRIEIYRAISFSKSIPKLDGIYAEMKDRFGIAPPATMNLLELFRCKLRLRKLALAKFKKISHEQKVFIEPHEWDDDLKLAWVLEYPKELAFQNEQRIILKIDKIWNRMCGELPNREPYSKYSYYNEDNRPEPMEVLQVLIHFCEWGLDKTKSKLAQNETPLVQATPSL